MTTSYDILPPAESSLLAALSPLKSIGFVLYGGTAIALRLGHRRSLGFDFRTDQPLNRAAIIAAVPALAYARTLHEGPEAWEVQLSSPDSTLHAVDLSFAVARGRVGVPDLDDGGSLLLASPDDLLAHELNALLHRGDARDYRDIAALLETGLTLGRGLGAARTLFPDLSLSEMAKALVYFEAGDLGEVSAADRAILTGEVVRLTSVADMPLRSRRLDLAEPEIG